MNKTLRYLAFALLFFFNGASFLHSQVTFHAFLAGRNEVQPVLSRASGEVTATLTDSTLVVSGSFRNLSAPVDLGIAGGMHLHRGYAGQNGPILFPLTAELDSAMTSGVWEGTSNTFSLTTAQVDALKNRRFYINIHNQNHPSGEIRGQLLPVSDDYLGANLFGSNEAPPVLTGASGAVAIELSGNELILTGSFDNLEGDFAANIAGGAHLHLNIAGSNGPIGVELHPTVDTDLRGGIFEAANNTFPLDSALMAALKARRVYCNVHTSLWPSGEIRGQVVSGKATAVFRSHLSGSSEAPAVVTSLADGAVLFELSQDSVVTASGSFHNLSAPLATSIGGGAHVHTGMAGRSGGIAFPLVAAPDSILVNGAFEAVPNTFNLTADQLAALFSRRLYANVHSQNHLPGEIRGQLLPEGQAVFNAFLSTALEVPEVFSGGRGDVKAELSGNHLTVSGSFDDLGGPFAPNIAGGAHIHLGLAGSTGSITFPLTVTPDPDNLGGVFRAADNVLTLDSAQIANLRARRFYINVHSNPYPAGEVRGQLLPHATTYFVAPLSGTSETASVNSTGRGMTILEVNGSQGYLSGSFTGLTTAFDPNIAGGSHIHRAMAGSNGGIRFELHASPDAGNLSGKFEVADNALTLTAGDLDTLLRRMNYVNIHTAGYPAGEVRGQLLPLATHYFTSTLRGINEVAINNSTGKGDLKAELTGNVLTVHGSFNSLQSPFNPAVAGGAHLHLAMAGEEGGIIFPLAPALDANNLGGIFQARDNVFVLDSAQIAALGLGNLYANIHTNDFPGGEIRGQLLKETNLFPAPETNITSPPDGAYATIGGNPNAPFTAEWLPGFEPDGNKQVYIWQLATDSAFTDVIFQTYTGDQNSFSTDFATVDGLLASQGLALGDTVKLWHRAYGSDGAVVNLGTAATVNLIRGDFTQQQGVDLQLSITANVAQYAQYVDVTYTVTITNAGTETATGVTVAAGLPTGMVHTFNFTNKGSYNLFFERWDVGTLAPGESGTLSLVLFPLINNAGIKNFVQVLTQNETDVDSSPGNDVGETADEDDEAAVTVSGPTLPPPGGVVSDLELSAISMEPQYDIYEDVHYHLTLTNAGPDDAANITVQAGLPQGMVHTSNFASHGQYNLFFQRWEVGYLPSGETAHLDLVLFPLIDNVDISNFFQVLTCDQDDPDSTPGNDIGQTPDEDDEALVTVAPSPFSDPAPQNRAALTAIATGQAVAFPVPATTAVSIFIVSEKEYLSARISMFDLTGRLVRIMDREIVKGANQWTFDLSELSSGVYFVKIPGQAPVRIVKL